MYGAPGRITSVSADDERMSSPKFKPKKMANPVPAAEQIRGQGTGHNTFRPDVYRVSEGYLS